MSRAYRVAVNEQLRRHLKVEDGISSKLEVLPILPGERMGELLGAELGHRGFLREGEQAVRREADGVVVAVDLKSGKLEVTARQGEELALSAEQVALVNEDQQAGMAEQLRRQARQGLERSARAREEALAREVAQRVERRLEGLRGELDEVVNRVTAAALKERAAQLGTVEEIHEDAATGTLTIKVKV